MSCHLNEHDDLMIGRQGMKYNDLTKSCSHKFFSGEDVPIHGCGCGG